MRDRLHGELVTIPGLQRGSVVIRPSVERSWEIGGGRGRLPGLSSPRQDWLTHPDNRSITREAQNKVAAAVAMGLYKSCVGSRQLS